MNHQLSQSDYRDIGILVHRTSPETAYSFLQHIRAVQPELNNIDEIKDLFSQFCSIKGIDGINCRRHSKTEYVYLRHVFIAVVIKLYNPELLSSTHQFRMKRKLRVELSRLLKTHVTWISQNISIVCVRLGTYEEFNEDVADVIERLEY